MIRKSPIYRTSFPTWFYRTWYETCSVGNPFNSTTKRIDWTAHESFISIHITSEIAIQKFEWIVIWSGFFCGSTTMISLQRIPNIAGPLFPEEKSHKRHPRQNLNTSVVPITWKKTPYDIWYSTVDGWNPAPVNNGINYLSTGAGFQPSTVCPTHTTEESSTAGRAVPWPNC